MIRFLLPLLLLPLSALAGPADWGALTHPGARECVVDLPPEGSSGGAWTAAEHYAWKQICLGEWADMRLIDGDDGLPCNPFEIEDAEVGEEEGDGVPATRVLRSEFLQLILTREPWVSAPVKPQVRIQCAQIERRLDLKNQHVRAALSIANSHLPGGADLLGARFDRTLSFQGSVFGANLQAGRLQVGGSVLLRGGAKFKEVGLIGARIGGNLDAYGSEFDGSFNADRLQVGGGVFLNREAKFKEVRLLGARIGGNLNAIGSEFDGLFKADYLQVEGGVYLRGGAKFKDVRLLGARINRDLSAIGSEFDGFFDAENLQVGGDVLFRGGASFLAVDLNGARIGRHLQLAGSKFAGTFALTGVTIGELVLFRPGTMVQYDEDNVISDDPVWGDNAKLILRNAALGALQSRPQSWRRGENDWIEAELTGLTYNRLAGFRAGEGKTMLDASAEELVQWLEGVRPASMKDRYDPGPYEQLVAALRREGMVVKADAVRFDKFRHRDANPGEEISWWSEWVYRPASRWLLGYGVYPFTLGWWFAGLVLLGFIVSFWTCSDKLKRLDQKIWYSVDNTVPLIELKHKHKEIVHGRCWVEGFFHAQKLLGFIFATLLIGALSLLTE